VLFPTWHKKRHHKRRLIQPPFVELDRVTPARGWRLPATDWEEYALQIPRYCAANPVHESSPGGTGCRAWKNARPRDLKSAARDWATAFGIWRSGGRGQPPIPSKRGQPWKDRPLFPIGVRRIDVMRWAGLSPFFYGRIRIFRSSIVPVLPVTRSV
jgi:hypothetical protein